MNIFSKLFGKQKTAMTNNAANNGIIHNASSESIHPTPDKELFVDSDEPTKQPEQEQPSKIIQVLSRNYHALGARDGYAYHSSENLTTGKRKIGAEFRLILDQEIQEKEEKRLQLENLIIDVSSVSASTLQKLQNTLQRLNVAITLLERQKELSIEEEGWIMNAIYSYQQGFSQGLTDYIESETLLSPIKNI